MSRVNSTRVRAKRNSGSDPMIVAVSDITRDIAKLRRIIEAQGREIKSLGKQNKYLKDRVSSIEHSSNRFTRSIQALETNVSRLMGIFRR